MQLLKVPIFHFYHTHTFEKHHELYRDGMLTMTIFLAREKRRNALFLCLRSYVRPARRWVLPLQPVEAVFYSPGTYFTLGDNKSRWTTLLERAEFNRVERNRYVSNVVKQGVALRRRIIAVLTCWWGTYEVRHVMVVRRKYRCHRVPSGRFLIPDDIFMGPHRWLLRQKSRRSIKVHKSLR